MNQIVIIELDQYDFRAFNGGMTGPAEEAVVAAKRKALELRAFKELKK